MQWMQALAKQNLKIEHLKLLIKVLNFMTENILGDVRFFVHSPILSVKMEMVSPLVDKVLNSLLLAQTQLLEKLEHEAQQQEPQE